jgi:hypothetical protein
VPKGRNPVLKNKKRKPEARYALPKAIVKQVQENKREFKRVGTDFLKVEVATGLTFAGIAQQTDDAAKKRRNQRSARKAFDTATRLSKDVDFNRAEAELLSRDLERLKSELRNLGEIF